MILVSDLIVDIRTMISEVSADNSFFTDATIISFINSAALTLCRRTRLPQAILTSELQIGVREIALPRNVQNVYSVKIEINSIDYFNYDDFLKSGLETVGTPSLYYLREHYDDNLRASVLALGFNNIPDRVAPIEIHTTLYPNRVSTLEDTLPFSSECALALKFAALNEIYEKDVKFDKATYYLNKFNLEVDNIKSKLFNRVTDYVR